MTKITYSITDIQNLKSALEIEAAQRFHNKLREMV